MWSGWSASAASRSRDWRTSSSRTWAAPRRASALRRCPRARASFFAPTPSSCARSGPPWIRTGCSPPAPGRASPTAANRTRRPAGPTASASTTPPAAAATARSTAATGCRQRGWSLERLRDYPSGGLPPWAPCPTGATPLAGTSPPPAPAAGGLALTPNPFDPRRERLWLDLRGEGGALAVDIFDAAGRPVQRLEASLASGLARLVWDGRDARGRELVDGAYPARALAVPDGRPRALPRRGRPAAERDVRGVAGRLAVLALALATPARAQLLSLYPERSPRELQASLDGLGPWTPRVLFGQWRPYGLDARVQELGLAAAAAGLELDVLATRQDWGPLGAWSLRAGGAAASRGRAGAGAGLERRAHRRRPGGSAALRLEAALGRRPRCVLSARLLGPRGPARAQRGGAARPERRRGGVDPAALAPSGGAGRRGGGPRPGAGRRRAGPRPRKPVAGLAGRGGPRRRGPHRPAAGGALPSGPGDEPRPAPAAAPGGRAPAPASARTRIRQRPCPRGVAAGR
ncbi:MAG: hypothetical protein H6694_00255 [Candidatus Latescibacteria bacterium]|nr:hypothetical protein [Candidatus Latescibacterota bacterium]